MIRTQISLDEEQYRFLKEHAHRRGESLSAVIRHAVDRLREGEGLATKAAHDVLGAHQADVADASEQHDRYLLLAAEPRAAWNDPEGGPNGERR